MSNRQTSKDLHSVTSSQELVDGQEHYSLQGGVQTDLFGQEVLPVSHSRSQESRKEQMTSDISGPSGSISSESADLQSYLESKLLPLSDKDGLIPCKKIWKQKTTPAQRRYCQLQVSALSTKGIGSGSWPTPSATDHKGGYQGGRIRNGKWSVDRLDVAAQLTSQWLTPTTSDTNGTRELDGKRSGGLNTQATTLWGTPVANPANGTPEAFLERKRKAVVKGSKMGICLSDIQMQAKTVPWPTVTTQDNAQMAGQYSKTNGTTLGGAVRQCNAKTEKSAPSQLNPRFSLWLMGYPIEWAYCAERVTPLSRRSQQSS